MENKKNNSGIWIFWSVLFGLISLASMTGLLFMYLYFTEGAGKRSASSGVPAQEAAEGGAEQAPAENLPENTPAQTSPAPAQKPVSSDEAALPEETAQQPQDTDAAAIREAAREELLQEMKTFMQQENSTVRLLRTFYQDDVIVYSDGMYHFVPINRDLAPCPYDPALFVQDESTGRLSYTGDAKTHFGIDVSKFQDVIDWEQVASEGVEFALIRLGLRGYTEGAIMPDEAFEANIDGAAANGIHAGVYFFSQARNEAEVDEELDYIFAQLEGHAFDGPIVIDVEDVNNGNGRTGSLTAAERTDLTIRFCEKVKERGHLPMIYGNLKSMILMLEPERLEDYPKWYAYYDLPVYYPYQYDILQYKDTGRLKGIEGDVDFNLAFNVWYE